MYGPGQSPAKLGSGALARQSPTRNWVLIALVAVVVVVLFSSRHRGAIAVPSFAGVSCPQQAPVSGTSGIRLDAKVSDGQVFVPVCFGRRGPYAFVLDSGSATTAISPALRSQLGLALTGGTHEVEGLAAKATAETTVVTGWQVSGLPLRSDDADVIASLPPGEPGLLGMDVLARLGAIRIDYSEARLAVAGPEDMTLPVASPSAGAPQALSLSDGFLGGSVRQARIVDDADANDLAFLDVSFGAHGPFVLELDSGNSSTEVAPFVVRQAALHATGASEVLGAIGGTTTGKEFNAGSWSASGVALPARARVVELDLVAPKPVGGFLGGNVFSRYRFVVLDFRDQLLLFGPPE